MFQHGCNNLPLNNQQQNVGEGGGGWRRGEGTLRQSKSKEGVRDLGSSPS
jgi:hypothetical protein